MCVVVNIGRCDLDHFIGKVITVDMDVDLTCSYKVKDQ